MNIVLYVHMILRFWTESNRNSQTHKKNLLYDK